MTAQPSAPRRESVPRPPAVSGEDPLTTRARLTWTAGDFHQIARGFEAEAEAFISRLALRRGERVLDVACGTGNLTLPAARAGAVVTGLDIAPNLLATLRQRADAEGTRVALDEGNAEALPYADGQFDTVVSMFGVMFAARPERAVAELLRVTRPGGRIALANWTREGLVGEMLRLHVARVPAPPGVPSTLLWGDEAAVRERFGDGVVALGQTRRMLQFDYPHSPAGVAELFRECYGPTVRTFAAIDPDARAGLAAELAALWARANTAEGRATRAAAEYLEVIAVRA